MNDDIDLRQGLLRRHLQDEFRQKERAEEDQRKAEIGEMLFESGSDPRLLDKPAPKKPEDRDCVGDSEADAIEEALKFTLADYSQVRRMCSTIRALHKEVRNLLNKIAHTPDLKGEIAKHQFKPGDVIVFSHARADEECEDLGSFGYGLSALNTLKRRIEEVAGGPVLVIASNKPLDATTVTGEARRQLREKLGIMDAVALRRSVRDLLQQLSECSPSEERGIVRQLLKLTEN